MSTVMPQPYGASPEAWAHFDLVLGLGTDLLPIVCQPGLPVAPSSVLSEYGKAPSRLTLRDEVVGFPKWTTYQATDGDLEAWSKDSRLGICLQTRSVRAIDVDVTDQADALAIASALHSAFGVTFPRRGRANSSKFLLLYQCEGDLPKVVIPVAHGMIELLGTGQQCVVVGTHPSGARYAWLGGFPCTIPIFTLDQRKQLITLLSDSFATGPVSTSRSRRIVEPSESHAAVHDDVADYLLEHGLVQSTSHDGRLDIVCPFAETHTSGTGGGTSTSYFPAGTGGYQTSSFVCLHSHCSGRTKSDFLDAIGYLRDGFEILQEYVPPVIVSSDETAVTATGPDANGLLPPRPRLELTADGSAIKARINNVYDYLTWRAACGQWIRFDAFRDEIVLQTDRGPRPFTDADYTRLAREAERGMGSFQTIPHEMMRRAVHNVAQDALFDSAKAWLGSLSPWDGVDRLTTFMEVYLGAYGSTVVAQAYATSVGRYLWSAMAGRILHPGSQTDMVVILASPQGTGKSSSVRAMAPAPSYYTEINLTDSDADRNRLTRGKSLVELSELRGLRTKDLDAMKAIVTRREDSWTPKYMEISTTYSRRYLMIGTTNDLEFLADPSGARRWLPITVGLQDVAAITRDHAQLWAQAVVLFQTEGICWHEAQTLAVDEHEQFTVADSWEEIVTTYLQNATQVGVIDTTTVCQILQVGLQIPVGQYTRSHEMRVAAILRKLGWNKSRSMVHGVQQYLWTVPNGWFSGFLHRI